MHCWLSEPSPRKRGEGVCIAGCQVLSPLVWRERATTTHLAQHPSAQPSPRKRGEGACIAGCQVLSPLVWRERATTTHLAQHPSPQPSPRKRGEGACIAGCQNPLPAGGERAGVRGVLPFSEQVASKLAPTFGIPWIAPTPWPARDAKAHALPLWLNIGATPGPARCTPAPRRV